MRVGPLKLTDIARLAKVSISTVSRALSDNPLLPKEKREEIQKIARDAGYVINHSAPPLTTVRQDLQHGAVTPVDLLFKKIGGEPVDSVILAPKLIIRRSCEAVAVIGQ